MAEELLERRAAAAVPPAEGLETPEPSLVPPAPPPGLGTTLYEHDERFARADLRRQIAVLELELAQLVSSAFPRKGIEFGVGGASGPRVLSLDELERIRDALAARIGGVKKELDRQVAVETRKRELIEEMVADPGAHKWIRVSNHDIGEPGCKHWHARPSWGLLGMLAGWWRVNVSSGCPLAEGLRPPDAGEQAPETKAAPPAVVGWTRASRPRGAGRERYRVGRRGSDAAIA